MNDMKNEKLSGIGSKRLKVKTGDLIECEGKVFVFGKDRGTGEIKTFNISNMEASCASGGEDTVAERGPCKVCGKPFDSNDELYEHYDTEHNKGAEVL